MFDRVVAGWDGSSAADSALDWSLERPGVAELVVLRVLDSRREGRHASSADVLASVDRVVAEGRAGHPGLRITSAVAEGRPDQILAGWATRGSLLVLGVPDGPHEAAGKGLATRVALTAEGPVALVPEGASRRIGEVVVGIDGSEASAAAAEVAAGEALDRRTAVVAVHVRREPDEPEVRLDPDDAAGGLVGRFPRLLVRHRHVHGEPAVELARAGAAASVLVLGRHDETDPATSVALRTLSRLGVPTIVVSSADATRPLPAFTRSPG
jgi:hypothetical protein